MYVAVELEGPMTLAVPATHRVVAEYELLRIDGDALDIVIASDAGDVFEILWCIMVAPNQVDFFSNQPIQKTLLLVKTTPANVTKVV